MGSDSAVARCSTSLGRSYEGWVLRCTHRRPSTARALNSRTVVSRHRPGGGIGSGGWMRVRALVRGSGGAPKSRQLDTRARGRLDACPSSGLDASAQCGPRVGLAQILTSVMRRREGLIEGITGWRHSGWWSRRRWLPAVWQRVGQRRRPSVRAPSRLLGQFIDSLRVARQAAHTSSHAADSFAARAALRGAEQVGGGHSRARSTQVWAQLLDLPLAVGGGLSQLGCRYGGGHARASWRRRGCN